MITDEMIKLMVDIYREKSAPGNTHSLETIFKAALESAFAMQEKEVADKAFCLQVELDMLVEEIHNAKDLASLQDVTKMNFPEIEPEDNQDGWIDWRGQIGPVPDYLEIETKYRNGEIHKHANCDWKHRGIDNDIIGYRFIKPNTVKPEWIVYAGAEFPEREGTTIEIKYHINEKHDGTRYCGKENWHQEKRLYDIFAYRIESLSTVKPEKKTLLEFAEDKFDFEGAAKKGIAYNVIKTISEYLEV